MNVQPKTSKRHKGTGLPGLCAFFSFEASGILWVLSFLFITQFVWSQKTEESFIILKSKEKLIGKVELKSPFFGVQYLLFEDTAKFGLEKIQAFQNEDGYYAVANAVGFYGKPKLFKRTQAGKVNLFTAYQVYSSPGSYNAISNPGGRMTQYTPGVTTFARFDYFSKDNGDILPATRDNLMAALSDHPKSIRLLREHQTLGTVKVVLVLAGLGLIGAAFLGADKDHPPSVGLLIAGGIAANLSWIPFFMQAGKIEKAIEVYNE